MALGYPVVDSITPIEGPATGGTSVTILGRHFTTTTDVDFDGVPATSFTVDDDNTISAVSPAGSGGFIQVDITNARGTTANQPKLTDDSGGSHHGTYASTITVAAGLVPDGDAWPGGIAGREGGPSQGPTLLDPASSCAVELWYQSDDPVTMQMLFTSSVVGESITFYGPGGADPGFGFQTRLSMQGDTPGSNSFNGVGDPFPYDGDPHHIVTVWNPDPTQSSVDLYIDGSFVASYEDVDPGNPDPQPAPTFTEPFDRFTITTDAVIDELAVYSTPPSSGDIAAHFSAASSSYDDYRDAVLANTPTAYYRFDDEIRPGYFRYLGGSSGWRIGRMST